MDALDNDPDLDALRSEVLASIKLKNGSDFIKRNPITRTDNELEELRKAALKSTKKQNDSLVKQQHPVVKLGLKVHNRNTNLIVIQPFHKENETNKSQPAFSNRGLRRPDNYCQLKYDDTSRQQQQPRVKDKFSRYVSSSSSEDESDFSDSESSASDTASQTSETKSLDTLEERDRNTNEDVDVLVLQPEETFDENVDKLEEEKVKCGNGVRKGSEKSKDLSSDKTLKKKPVEESERRQEGRSHRGNEENRSDRSKRRHRDDPARSLHRKHRKHDRDHQDSTIEGRQRRRSRERRNEEWKKEANITRNKGEDGRLKLSSILSKSTTDEKKSSHRSSRSGEKVRSKSLERNSKVGELQDLREKLKLRKRTGTETDEEEKEEEQKPPVKRKSRGASEERRKRSRSKSKSPPIKSVLSVVKLTSSLVEGSRKRAAVENKIVNSPSKVNDSANSERESSPVKCEPSPERKVLIRSRHSHTYTSEADDVVQRDSRIHITVSEEVSRNIDSSGSGGQSPKQKLPVHLRLGNLPSASNTSQQHSLQVHLSDRKRKSVSPSKPSDTSSSSSSSAKSGAPVAAGGADRKMTTTTTVARQVVKLSSERVRSIATILSKHGNSERLPSNKVQQLTGKTFENELDEKIRRIRVNNLAIMKRKSEIEREQHNNG